MDHNQWKTKAPVTWEAYQKLSSELGRAELELEMLSRTVNGGTARLAVDDGMRVIMASEGYYRMTGYTEEESLLPPFCGRGVNLVLPQDRPVVADALERLARRETVQISYRIRKKDGTVAWSSAYCAEIDDRGPERTIDVFFIDITDSKQTELALESLLNDIPAGVVRAAVGKDRMRVLYANREFYRQMGYRPEEFAAGEIQNQYLAVVHPEDRTHLLEYAHSFAVAEGDRTAEEYRVLTKEGRIKWIRMSASRLTDPEEPESVLQGVLSDVTEERQRQLAVALNEERYRIISEQTRDTVFDWDLEHDSIQFSPVYQKMFGFLPPPGISVRSLTEYNIIHQDDKPGVEAMIEAILGGAPNAEAEYRAICADGSYLWCRNRVTNIFDDAGRPIRAIGLLTDISEYKQTTSVLREQATRDSLTGLLNRMTFQRQVEQLLREQPDGRYVFLMFDVDRFKQINDTRGHAAGDEVLKRIARLLSAQFRTSDLFARMGGDEFASFLGDISAPQSILEKLDRLREQIGRAEGEFGCGATISLGMAAYPENGEDFESLYQCADRALYRAKHSGGDACRWEPGEEGSGGDI